MRWPHGGIDWLLAGDGAIWGLWATEPADVSKEPKMTQIVRYTHPTQAEMEAVMAEAREMRAALIASFFRGIGQKLRGFHVGGKAPAAA